MTAIHSLLSGGVSRELAEALADGEAAEGVVQFSQAAVDDEDGIGLDAAGSF